MGWGKAILALISSLPKILEYIEALGKTISKWNESRRKAKKDKDLALAHDLRRKMEASTDDKEKRALLKRLNKLNGNK